MLQPIHENSEGFRAKADVLRIVRCPVCNSRIGDRNIGSHIAVHVQESLLEQLANLYVKCWKCKVELGIQITE